MWVRVATPPRRLPAGADGAGVSTDTDHRALLERFQPCLRYDSVEAYFADAAEEWTANPANRLCDADGRVIATAADDLSLDYLDARYPGGEDARAGDYIESTRDDYGSQYSALRQARPELRNTIYGRTASEHERLWLQYWFFYFLNDYQLAWGIDVHEGDWEMVELRMNEPGTEPDTAVYAQHTFCEIRPWPDVRRLAHEKASEGLPIEPGDSDRALVYAGRGSHASFFEPGYHATDFYDVSDGRRRSRREARLEVVDGEPPGWLRWPGRWGGSRTGYQGPGAPSIHDQWTHPDALMAKQPRVRHQEPAPDDPRLWARRRRGRLLLEFDFTHLSSPPRRLVATVNSEDETDVPPHTHRFALMTVVLGSLQTSIAIDPEKHYDVSLAIVDGDGRPSGAQIFVLGPSAGIRGLIGRLGAAAGRLVHLVRLALGGE
jgi:hypothetical protein